MAPATGGIDADGFDPDAPLLTVRDLTVEFSTDDGVVHAVDKVSFELRRDETLGIVGESGSGKSVTSMAILGLLPKSANISGEIVFMGRPILGIPEKELDQIHGARIAMIFQDALAALNPVFKVGKQIAEAISTHESISGKRPAGTRGRSARDRGHPEPGRARRAVPARVLGWDAPAGDDRDVDREPARRADRR